MVVVVEKAPDGLAVVTTGSMVRSLLRVNASEYRMRWAQSVAAPSGPTDPDRVTVCPARTGLGLTWTATGGVVDAAQAGAAETVSSPAVAANRSVAMVRIGRMVISPRIARPWWCSTFSVAGAGHGRATTEHRGRREPVSTRSRSSIETSTPSKHQGVSATAWYASTSQPTAGPDPALPRAWGSAGQTAGRSRM